MEAMVKRKADFAGRPASVTCERIFNISQATNNTSLNLNRVIFKKKKEEKNDESFKKKCNFKKIMVVEAYR